MNNEIRISNVSAEDDYTNIIGIKERIFQINEEKTNLSTKIKHLENEKSLMLSLLKKILQKTESSINKIEQKFGIKYNNDQVTKANKTKDYVNVDIGLNIMFNYKTYPNKEAIPIMGYGSVLIDSRYMVLFRVTDKHFVSVGKMLLKNPTPHQTTSCTNGNECKFRGGCKYFHDPLYWKYIHYPQRIYNNPYCIKYPTFGDFASFKNQDIDFEDVSFLTRYCVNMLTLIHIKCSK
jgi:hypothetical protein